MISIGSLAKRGWWVVLPLFALMFGLALISMSGDSLTFDELAHITAGYTYLTAQDYRINPEHPPLIKDLAALPLLGQDLNFPYDSQNWRMDAGPPPWWVQFDLGKEFLYRSGNDPRAIIFWSRVPMIALTVVLGLFLYGWARQIGGKTVGLGVAVLYALSPTFLAHGRLVATDIGVVLGAVVAMYFWINFLKKPTSVWRILGAAVGFGFAMLLKFSLVLLIPTFIILTVLAALLFNRERRGRAIVKYILLAGLAGVLSLLLVIMPFYQAHIANYPAHRQVRDTIADLQPDGLTLYEQALGVYGADKVLLRPAAQFFRGVLMAAQRVQFGNTVYFLGQVKGTAFWYYFPIIFLVKLPPGVLLLFATGGVGLGLSVWHRIKRNGAGAGLVGWLREHFTLSAMILFGVIYWFVALVGNLNIGIRHVSITIPLFYILAMWGVVYLGRHLAGGRRRRGLKILVTIAFGWYVISSALAFPHYLSYYNIFGGGTENGYKVAVDSNYDWGQDFYRLVEFIEKENIDHIYLDYFGGEDPEYWLGEKVTRFNPRDFSEAPKGWVAISLNQLMGGIGEPVFEEGLNLEHGFYNWILPHEPVARAGKSILIYNIK